MKMLRLVGTALVALSISDARASASTAWHASGPFEEALGTTWVEVRPVADDGDGFLIMTTEVTRRHWEMLMDSPAPSPRSGCEAQNCPLTWLSGYAMLELANRASDVEGLPRCYALEGCTGEPASDRSCDAVDILADCVGYRLPTAAEWRAAAAAGAPGPICPRHPDEALMACLEPEAWWSENADGRAQPVATRLPNGWGLYDLHGNVDEMAQATAHDDPAATVRLSPDATIIIIGGSYMSSARRCVYGPGLSHHLIAARPDLGLRLVRTVPATR